MNFLAIYDRSQTIECLASMHLTTTSPNDSEIIGSFQANYWESVAWIDPQTRAETSFKVGTSHLHGKPSQASSRTSLRLFVDYPSGEEYRTLETLSYDRMGLRAPILRHSISLEQVRIDGSPATDGDRIVVCDGLITSSKIHTRIVQILSNGITAETVLEE
jgi:hypothetical protein